MLGVLPAPEQSFSTQHACAVTVKQALVSTTVIHSPTLTVYVNYSQHMALVRTLQPPITTIQAQNCLCLLYNLMQACIHALSLMFSRLQSLRIYIQTDALKYSRNKGTLPYLICLLEMNTVINIPIREYDLSNKTGTY